ncbi:hypothetical protein GCK72_022395 [Caenorhabditis remanei]|uniref:Uncharacterized protein n=1 Tax=Caenorhabditis remanei TaxID=31234 RepID=A0A6A5FTN3_CAERE|nr:hypothetical protein GCK72_022395 [Caenorhabditis remanei]KAF1745947.1 hypothetical protein GCK72_022395 [Caenorhabditis remanei]
MTLLVVPIFYMPITIIIILRIFVKLLYAVKDKNVNVPLFSAICISQFMINGTILRVALPIIFIYPFFNTFFLFTAECYCVQAHGPFPFGSIILGFQGSLFGLRNSYFLLFNTIFWMSSCLINNSILLVKLFQLKKSLSLHARSQKSYKAEVSLTFTTFSMIFSYLSNSMIVITAQLGGDWTYYVIMLRPFGNDLETCVSPWVFYLTHPIFRRKKSTIRVVHHDNIDS